MVTRRRCCPTARCSSQGDGKFTAPFSRARNFRSGERNLDGHWQPCHRRLVTRRRCCPTARCSSPEVSMTRQSSRARNSPIRRAEPGRPPTASPPDAMDTATLLLNGKVLVAEGYNIRRQSCERGIVRSGERDLEATANLIGARWWTRRRCYPTARCCMQEDCFYMPTLLRFAELYDSASGAWTETGRLTTCARLTYGDVVAQRQVLVAGGNSSLRRLSQARNSMIRRVGLDSHRPPRHGTRDHTATLLPNGQVLVAGE